MKEIEFDPEALVQAVEDVANHLSGKKKTTLRTTKVHLPEAAPQVEPQDVIAARESLNVSQHVFARILNVPTVTAISWEKGRRKPSGAALRLLQIIKKNPKVLMEI